VYGFSGSVVPSELSPAGTGVFGRGPTNGVVGRCDAGTAVRGEATTGVGVLGTAGPTGIAGRFVGRTVVEGVIESQGLAAIGAVRANKLVCPKTSGIATLSRAASSITIPNLPVSPVSLALATLQKRVKGLHVEAAVPSASGKKVTIYFNKRAPKGTKVSWMLVN
jgi:hypothetical protein